MAPERPEKIREGDIVARKSYAADILFCVMRIEKGICFLKGLDLRLLADAPLDDLIKVDTRAIEKYHRAFQQESLASLKKVFVQRVTAAGRSGARAQVHREKEPEYMEYPGRVLHLDGDPDYLAQCLHYYRELRIPVVARHVPEAEQPQKVRRFLEEVRPDLLVLTGHDGMLRKEADRWDLRSYRTSRYFVAAVREARRYDPDKDSLVIFAGACQSYYEALIEAGANFASSPQRIFIHCYDPVFVIEKIAFAPIGSVVGVNEALGNSVTGIAGIGGLDTQGKFRLGLPRLARKEEEEIGKNN